MEEVKGVVKHVLLVKFKEGISAEEQESLIKGLANLVSLIEPMKSFHWGTDVSLENMHQGFTHIFESTFESVEGVSEYLAHPPHVELQARFFQQWRKLLCSTTSPLLSVFEPGKGLY